MGAAYSQDLRDRVLKAYDRGMASKQIADLFVVSPRLGPARQASCRRGERPDLPQGPWAACGW